MVRDILLSRVDLTLHLTVLSLTRSAMSDASSGDAIRMRQPSSDSIHPRRPVVLRTSAFKTVRL